MTEIDVTDDVEFIASDDNDFAVFIRCVCGEILPYQTTVYDDGTRMLWFCPRCNARLYFRDSDGRGTKIFKVTD